MDLPACIDDTAPILARLADASSPPHLLRAAEAVSSALRLYGPSRLVLSFNGGKDATALLHLVRAVFTRDCGPGCSPRCVFWHNAGSFPEAEAFVEDTARRYRLDVVRYDGTYLDGMRDAVERLGVAAVLLGTREADPNGAGADVVQPSSLGWPPFMRVNPLLRWSYSDVWSFLRDFGLPYCSLYDCGYTSLGLRDSTRPNAALQRPDGSFAPAHELQQQELERGGRS